MSELTPLDGPLSTPVVMVPPRGGRFLIAIGGGRGGVGKSLLTVNLAVYLAQLGRNVLVIDADGTGANLHSTLGLSSPPVPPRDPRSAARPPTLETSVPGLRLLTITPDAAAPRASKRSWWAEFLRGVEGDFIVLDLGPGVSSGTLDLFLSADVGLCVTTPEPPAIEATYVFLRALFLRRLRKALMRERFKLKIVERLMSELPPWPLPLDLIRVLERSDPSLAQLALGELARLSPRLVVNGTRVRTDNDLGITMQAMSDRYLGVDLDYIGHIEHDDAVWLTVRRRRPLLIDSPTSKSARLIERIARRVVALTTTREPRAYEPRVDRRYTLYDVLGISRGASDEDVRRAYKRQRELFAPGSLPLISILDEGQIQAEQARIEEAHDTLLDPNRRRAYDLSVFPETEAGEAPPLSLRKPLSAEQLQLQAELAREIQLTTEFSGAFLRKIRESQGIELPEIAARTKISLAHLSAIEEERYTDLPAVVYVRGFVREIAKLLKLDPAQVDRTYLKRLREGLAALGRPVG
ncbi:MAG: helix-turn-helix domain-containing protein [Polyangiaceae bacterium]|nr:helix-turn-helix domain-containing protein [Polyangiaceae bacterium]